jgi:hypothetical protein
VARKPPRLTSGAYFCKMAEPMTTDEWIGLSLVIVFAMLVWALLRYGANEGHSKGTPH